MNIVPSGTYCESEIPDTLDLEARAGMAVRGIMNAIDPTLMTMFGLVRFTQKSPRFRHWSVDVPLDAKFAESLPLMRLMSGSKYMEELESGFREELLSRIDDGLYWDRYSPLRPWRNIYGNSAELYGTGRDEDFSNVWGVGRMIRALIAWSGINGADTDALNASMVRGLRRIAVDKDDYSYYPHRGGWGDGFMYPRSGWIDTSEADRDRIGPEGSVTCFQGHEIYAAAQVFARTGDPVAKELAVRLFKYTMLPKFWGGTLSFDRDKPKESTVIPDPPFRDGSQFGHWPTHFHARAIALRGLLYYATACGDDRALEFVRASYEFTMTQGMPRMGFINTYPLGCGCEACALGDLSAMAVRLTDAGAGDYWDDLDALVRNHLAEQQVTDANALSVFCVAQPERIENTGYPENYENGDDVINRSLGLFFGTSSPMSIKSPFVMQCCTGNATQGLYYAWEGALRESGDSSAINLLLNRTGRNVDVSSWLPYEGKVVITAKKPCRVSIRIPRWVEMNSVEIRANAANSGAAPNPIVPERLGRYLTVRGLSVGDRLTLTFPIRENRYSYVINKGTQVEAAYDLIFRGSTLVSIKGGPELGANELPIYTKRESMRAGKAPMIKVTRFTGDRHFSEW